MNKSWGLKRMGATGILDKSWLGTARFDPVIGIGESLGNGVCSLRPKDGDEKLQVECLPGKHAAIEQRVLDRYGMEVPGLPLRGHIQVETDSSRTGSSKSENSAGRASLIICPLLRCIERLC